MHQPYTSDQLIHFVGHKHPEDDGACYRTILQVMKERRLRAAKDAPAPGLIETLGNGRISDETAVRGRVICFCDIPRQCLALHVAKYGAFGIAFTKRFLVSKGANPVFYVVTNAVLPGEQLVPTEDGKPHVEDRLTRGQLLDSLHAESARLSTTVWDLMKDREDLRPLLFRLDRLRGLIYSSTMAFIKPFDSSLPADAPGNYYMEREWRVHGDLAFGVSDVHCVMLPANYKSDFRRECPNYQGEIYSIRRARRATPSASPPPH